MRLREWCDAHPRGEMKGLRLAGPTGDPFTLAHAWRVGEADDPVRIGMFLHEGDATEGECRTVFTTWPEWMDTWTVRP